MPVRASTRRTSDASERNLSLEKIEQFQPPPRALSWPGMFMNFNLWLMLPRLKRTRESLPTGRPGSCKRSSPIDGPIILPCNTLQIALRQFPCCTHSRLVLQATHVWSGMSSILPSSSIRELHRLPCTRCVRATNGGKSNPLLRTWQSYQFRPVIPDLSAPLYHHGNPCAIFNKGITFASENAAITQYCDPFQGEDRCLQKVVSKQWFDWGYLPLDLN